VAAARSATIAGDRRKPHYREIALACRGPERIEPAGDDDDVKRDYFVAQTPDHATLWIYRERARPAAGICTVCSVDGVCLPHYRRTPSCIASAISLFCAGLRPEELLNVPPSFVTRRSPSPTNARSRGSARIAAKEYGLKLPSAPSSGCRRLETQRSPRSRAYGDLSQLITTAAAQCER
jgi:hypothetical protein